MDPNQPINPIPLWDRQQLLDLLLLMQHQFPPPNPPMQQHAPPNPPMQQQLAPPNPPMAGGQAANIPEHLWMVYAMQQQIQQQMHMAMAGQVFLQAFQQNPIQAQFLFNPYFGPTPGMAALLNGDGAGNGGGNGAGNGGGNGAGNGGGNGAGNGAGYGADDDVPEEVLEFLRRLGTYNGDNIQGGAVAEEANDSGDEYEDAVEDIEEDAVENIEEDAEEDAPEDDVEDVVEDASEDDAENYAEDAEEEDDDANHMDDQDVPLNFLQDMIAEEINDQIQEHGAPQLIDGQYPSALLCAQTITIKMLHANECNTPRCRADYCHLMKRALAHVTTCHLDCGMKYCARIKAISRHWQSCQSDTCTYCGPIRYIERTKCTEVLDENGELVGLAPFRGYSEDYLMQLVIQYYNEFVFMEA